MVSEEAQRMQADALEWEILQRLRSAHRLFRTTDGPGTYVRCDCPVREDHNEIAWRERHSLDEMGCPCPLDWRNAGIHDSFKCPLGIWRGPL